MLLVIPFFVACLSFINISALQKPPGGESFSIRRSVLETLILLGCFVGISSELLGLLHALKIFWVAVIWGVLLIANIIFGLFTHSLVTGIQRIRSSFRLEGRMEILLFSLILIILSLTLITGNLSPPNNYDSFLYHLPRVAHWIQNGSLDHYVTGYINQLAFPILAEEGILTVWLLGGSDTFAFMIQWLAYGGSILAASYLAQLLKGSRKAQWLAAFFTLSIPTVILQASSTQNDLVTGFWFLCLLVYFVLSIKRTPTISEFIFAGCTLGLGLLTKGTFYWYALIFLLFLLFRIFKMAGVKKRFHFAAALLLVVIFLNAGFWIRNVVTFKTPLGNSNLIIHHVYGGKLPEVLLNPIRNLALHFVTPDEKINQKLFGWLFARSGDSREVMPPYQVVFSWNDEDYAANPLHVLVLFIAFLLIFLLHKRMPFPLVFTSICILESYLIFSLGLRYNPFIHRLEVPFFLATAPLVGCVFDFTFKRHWLIYSLIILFFLSALPWVFCNKTRPLVALMDEPAPFALHTTPVLGVTKRSILIESKLVTFFARTPELMKFRVELIRDVQKSGCHKIGMRIKSSDPEYPYFWLLSAPLSGYRIENLEGMEETLRYIDPTFHPCVIICTSCMDDETITGFNLTGVYHDARLYLSP